MMCFFSLRCLYDSTGPLQDILDFYSKYCLFQHFEYLLYFFHGTSLEIFLLLQIYLDIHLRYLPILQTLVLVLRKM